MKNLKFSRLFAAALFVAVLVLSGCKPADDEIEEDTKPLTADDRLIGDWIDTWGNHYEISQSALNNYSSYGDCYAGNNIMVKKLSDSAGTIFIKYTRAYEFTSETPNPSTGWITTTWPSNGWYRYSTTAPNVGKWYAISYKELTNNSLKISGASKDNGRTACDTLEEAKAEFTIDNGYFGTYDDCTKQ